MKKILKENLPYIIIIVVVILLRIFIITPVRVDGSSMYPNLKNNQILLLKKYDKNFKRFDIVVLKYDKDKLIKRIIGLPNDKIKYEDNKLYVNDKYIKEPFLKNINTYDFTEITVSKNSYFVVGDNRENSKDSRMIGTIRKKDIEGTVSFSLIPFKKIK